MQLRITLLCASLALFTACGSDSDEAEGTDETAAADLSLPGDANAGEAIYSANCVACHAADGRGNGGMTGADFVGDETRLAKGNEQLLTSIRDGVTTGSTPMPAQAETLSDEEMRNVLSYIRREFGGTTE